MLERSSLPTYVPTELTDSLQQTFNRRRFEVLQEMLWLPETYQQYLLLLAGTLAVGLGMLVHIWLTVQIAEARALVSQLAAESQRIERENSELIYAIANSSTLTRVEAAARQQGFRPATERVYVRRDAVQRDAVRRDAVRSDGGRSAGLNGAAPESTTPVPSPATAAASSEDLPGAGLLDAVGRALGAAGEWLQRSAATTAQTVGGFTSGFRERWMP